MDLQHFRLTLRKRLRDQKLTLNALSLQADLSEDTLRSIIYGKSQDIKLSTIIKIANVLQCPLDDLAGRNFYPDQVKEITNRLCHLPRRSIQTINFMLQLEENTSLQKSLCGTDIIHILLPTGNMKDGMFYDNSLYEELDISQYPETLKQLADIGIKILSKNFEPVYFPNDILLLSHQHMPEYNDTVLYVDHDGRLYLRKFLETGLEPVNGFGKTISIEEQKDWKALGVVLKVVKEFNIEDLR